MVSQYLSACAGDVDEPNLTRQEPVYSDLVGRIQYGARRTPGLGYFKA